jgi:hypothetical protein
MSRRKLKGWSAKCGHRQGGYCYPAEKNRGRVVAEKNQTKLGAPRKRTENRAGEPHRIHTASAFSSSSSLSPDGRAPDQNHAAISSDGSSPLPAAARGLRHQVPCGLNGSPLLRQRTAISHHGVGRGRKTRPAPVSEDVGKEGLEGGSGGGGVPQLGGGRR